MDADWEVEIGGGAPIIEAHWPGFVDLRRRPERIGEIAEVGNLSALADLLLKMNARPSPLWTSKCDVWIPEAGALACYVDLLPRDANAFSEWRNVERFCQKWARRLSAREGPEISASAKIHPIQIAGHDAESEAAITLVVRQAITSQWEGFGITAYFSAGPSSVQVAEVAISAAMVAFSNAIPNAVFQKPEDRG